MPALHAAKFFVLTRKNTDGERSRDEIGRFFYPKGDRPR